MECIPYFFFGLLFLAFIFWCLLVAIAAIILTYFTRKKKVVPVLCIFISLIFLFIAYNIYRYDYNTSESEVEESSMSSFEKLKP